MNLKDISIINCDTGIKSEGPVDIQASNITFDNVKTPFDLASGSTGRIVDNRVVNDPKLRSRQERRESVTSGWRRPHGPPLPAYCPECKNIFPSRNYVFAGTYFYCWGNTEECVVCGFEKAELSKGAFDLSREAVEILRAPEITKQMVLRLAELGANVASGKLNPEEAIAAAKKIHPKLGAAAAILFVGAWSAFEMYSSIIGAVSATIDVYNKMFAPDPAIIIQQTVERAFREHDRLWHEKLQDPNRIIVGDQPHGQSNKVTADEKTDSKVTQPSSKTRVKDKKRKKQKKNKLKNHRQSFGGARSR